jgi:hypothetical protein
VLDWWQTVENGIPKMLMLDKSALAPYLGVSKDIPTGQQIGTGPSLGWLVPAGQTAPGREELQKVFRWHLERICTPAGGVTDAAGFSPRPVLRERSAEGRARPINKSGQLRLPGICRGEVSSPLCSAPAGKGRGNPAPTTQTRLP